MSDEGKKELILMGGTPPAAPDSRELPGFVKKSVKSPETVLEIAAFRYACEKQSCCTLPPVTISEK